MVSTYGDGVVVVVQRERVKEEEERVEKGEFRERKNEKGWKGVRV